MPSLAEICPVVLENKILKFRQYIFTLSLLSSPLKKVVVAHLNKLEFSLPIDALYQVLLTLAHSSSGEEEENI